MEDRKLITLTLKRKTVFINVAEVSPLKKRKEIADEFVIAPTTVTGISKMKRSYKQ